MQILKRLSRRERWLVMVGIGVILVGVIVVWMTVLSSDEEAVEEAELAELVTEKEEELELKPEEEKVAAETETKKTEAVLGNCTISEGNLMLINPNFRVGQDFIGARKQELISVSQTYGILEYRASNGDNLMMPEAAAHLAEMVAAYVAANPGHEMGTRSCFRERGTTCGRLCAATGTSDHHTGLTCDLVDNAYGSELDTDDYNNHKEWQWLRENSYKYGFIDRFPEAWAGGSMAQPINVDENGTTGLFETWHYRYVGIGPATEIATGKYNGGRYDSLEHYLKATGRVADLKKGICAF